MRAWSTDDIPDLTGTTAVVTGANSGIGAATTLALARAGALTVLACRSPERGERALKRVRAAVPGAEVRLVPLDLADLASVRTAADTLARTVDGQLDLLVNNAGVMALPLRLTADGFESQFGIDHLGHFALTGLLLPVLGASAPSRVVTVSSLAHRMGRIDFGDLQGERGYRKWPAYGQAKLANLLFTDELERRARHSGRDIRALAAHPGLSATELGQAGPLMAGRTWAARLERLTRLFTQTASAGALPVLRAATDPAARGGEYYGPRRPLEVRGAPGLARRSARARDARTAGALWEESARLTGVTPDFG
ncbi:oxidoreductase [Streptomyces sp. NPDC091212]|uniref:oxidoreductase n=1 Tax=Streptomyces sp. NPDC091212 TaxID=3155191 RepID=UPI003441BA7D